MLERTETALKTQKSLRIALLGHKRIPSREGGVEIVVEELSTRMVAQGHAVTCFNRAGHHVSGKAFDGEKIKDYKGVNLVTVPTLDKKGMAALTSSFFAALFAAFGKYDVIHFHAEGPCAMLWLPKLFGKRCVATIHGLDWEREKWKNGFGSKYIRFGEKIAVKFADEIIVLSRGVQEYFRQSYGRETRFIPNGVSRPETRKADLIKNKFGIDKDEYILFLGRIVPEKGLRYLIQAYRELQTDKKLVIAGGSSDTDDFMKEIQELANDERVIFTGFVSGQMLEELYSNAYLYVLPSDLEGMPLSLLEAMSYGNCCVVSNIAECTEVVENKAVIFQKGSVSDLKEKLKMLCDNPSLVQKYAVGAADFVCNKYNWDDIVQETLALYEEYR
ncbi:glycosyltransferase family 4 protein [Candidatus Allofournierella merdipullorum]|uniref:glycosyltransferase family 4 protein n=1 Tax=Candidatus Allofournierella merdipullorum TaxID=2838595 RepID=UPI003AB5D89D